jgi:hypothetical protein
MNVLGTLAWLSDVALPPCLPRCGCAARCCLLRAVASRCPRRFGGGYAPSIVLPLCMAWQGLGDDISAMAIVRWGHLWNGRALPRSLPDVCSSLTSDSWTLSSMSSEGHLLTCRRPLGRQPRSLVFREDLCADARIALRPRLLDCLACRPILSCRGKPVRTIGWGAELATPRKHSPQDKWCLNREPMRAAAKRSLKFVPRAIYRIDGT